MNVQDLDIRALDLLMDSVTAKVERIYSIMNALFKIKDDTPRDFGYERKDES